MTSARYRRPLAALALTLSLLPGLAAADLDSRIVAQFEEQGYRLIESGWTFVGRLRIVVENDAIRRELVINPRTGEILRDYSVSLAVLAARQEREAGRRRDRDSDDRPAVAAMSDAPLDMVVTEGATVVVTTVEQDTATLDAPE